MTVYLVWSKGRYSGAGLLAVFRTREAAEQAVRTLKAEDQFIHRRLSYEIQEVPVQESLDDETVN